MAALCDLFVHRLSKLSLVRCSQVPVRNFISSSAPLLFRATLPLQSEPMKKKKKMDMSIIVGREQKRRRKLEKAIKKQEMKGLKLKPIEEIEGNRNVLKTLDKRKRAIAPLSFDESECRALLHKEWSRYRTCQFKHEMGVVRRAVALQGRALLELRLESEQLYQQAIQLDDKLMPFEFRGPVETPPIKGYVAKDGDYIDTTKKFDK